MHTFILRTTVAANRAVHGLIENTTYWKNITDDLTKKYRFIAMDMRGTGRPW